MQLLWFIIKVIVVAVIQRLLTPDPESPKTENPDLPTVSQGRKIPLIFGRVLVKGPNVMEAGFFTTENIKTGGGFFSKSQIVGYRYYQNIEFAVAYGPGVLYDVIYGDHSLLSSTMTTNTTQSVSKRQLFGSVNNPGEGGFAGNIQFIPGSSSGYINTALQTETGRDQPGCPYLARVYISDTDRGAYWGNAATYRLVSFEYGYIPDPGLQSPSYSNINDDANPAYCLYELNRNPIWGLNIRGSINNSDIIDMAQTLYNEGLGYSRDFYQGDSDAIEREILDMIEGVTYRDPETGDIRYRLIRPDTIPSPMPTIGDDEIIEFSMSANTLSTAGTTIKVRYYDRSAGYKPIIVTESSTATFKSLGRNITVSRDFLGCSNATLARKLARREVAKMSRPLRKGKITCNRKPWDWNIGDSFLLSYSQVSIPQLTVRVTEIEKGTLEDSRIVIHWIEDVFTFGDSIYDPPTIDAPVSFQAVPANVSSQNIIEAPNYLIDNESANRIILFPQPVAGNLGYHLELNLGSWSRIDESGFIASYSLDSSVGPDATSIVIDSTSIAFRLQGASENDILSNKLNILIVFRGDGSQEFIGFTGFTQNPSNTTLSGLYRGLMDTFPQPISTSDTIYLVNDAYFLDYQFPDSQSYGYRYITYTTDDELSPGSATVYNETIANRYSLPALPGYVRINSSIFPSSVNGDITVTWAHRDRTEWNNSILAWDDATSQGPEAGTTYTVTLYDTSVSPWTVINQQTGLTGTTYSYSQSPTPTTTARIELKSVNSGNDSFLTFYHDFSWSP